MCVVSGVNDVWYTLYEQIFCEIYIFQRFLIAFSVEFFLLTSVHEEHTCTYWISTKLFLKNCYSICGVI